MHHRLHIKIDKMDQIIKAKEDELQKFLKQKIIEGIKNRKLQLERESLGLKDDYIEIK